jgi:predicted phage-related endonuclease
MEALDTIDSDISAAQAKLKEIQAQIEEKRHAVAGVNAEVEAALEKLAVVRAETTLAQVYHDQILDSVQSLRRQFALLEE